MVTALLDTSVLVDLNRGYQPAAIWLSKQTNIGITRIVWLEILEGASNKLEQERAVRLLNDFAITELTVSDLDWATRQLIALRLTYNIDAFDCLIAAPSYRLQIPVYTLNLKHFKPLLGGLAVQPY